MKLRIRGNKLRFRLGRTEVETLGRTGSIGETVTFGPLSQDKFSYSLSTTAGVEFSGSFRDGKITVLVPDSIVREWVTGDEVTIEGTQKLDENTDLSFLIEKDFVCLNAHNDEDQSDRYPHPKGEGAC